MEVRVINLEKDYNAILRLFSLKHIVNHALLLNDSKTFVVTDINGIIGMATLRFIGTLPFLQHFIINSTNLSCGRALINLMNRIEETVKELGFDRFVVYVDNNRKHAYNSIIRYFKQKILNYKQKDEQSFFLVGV